MDYGYGGYSSTPYGGGEGAGGFAQGETSSQSKAAYSGESRSVRPVTIKQLNDASQAFPEAPFKIDNADINVVCFVGQVRNVNKLATHVTYKLDDGTGETDVRYFIPPEEKDAFDELEAMDVMAMDTTGGGSGAGGVTDKSGRPRAHQVTTNGYAKVFANLKTFNDRRQVNAVLIRPITNINEYHVHFLEATAVHLYFTKGPPPKAGGSGAGAESGGGAMDMGGNNLSLPRMSPMARKLYDALSNSRQTNEGMHVNVLAPLMQVNVNEVYKAAEELLGLSVIYHTVDEDTWKILDC
ncbi:putative replication factor-a protein [Arthroderma uncinatum]|uniref:putative replication factor-a protein n=1 Tax=Arthroderma uncinatum TaxID=74035 RepID=UPI00144A9984|nr:putative replication factor-a protein [Arthroderma uncinatum]KAF3482172.1 putative replication factor-a protein [Arthroderma uncinatum]